MGLWFDGRSPEPHRIESRWRAHVMNACSFSTVRNLADTLPVTAANSCSKANIIERCRQMLAGIFLFSKSFYPKIGSRFWETPLRCRCCIDLIEAPRRRSCALS